MNWKPNTVRFCVLGTLLHALSAGVLAATTAEFANALQRPAMQIADAEKSVLLGAATVDSGRIVAVGERGVVVLSDDGGQSWRQALTPVSVTLTAVRFGGQQGVAVGHGGVVLTSANGGESWSLCLDGQRAAQIALQDAEASGDPLLLENAQLMIEEGPDKPFLDVRLGQGGEILAVGAYGLAMFSPDFGRTWQSWMSRLENPDGLHLNAVRQVGRTIVLAGERGLLLRSTDAGMSFSRLSIPYKGSLFTAELLSEDEMVLAGLRGSLLRSRDGGRSWQQLESPLAATFTSSTLDRRGGIYLANQAGQVLQLLGTTLRQVNSDRLPAMNGMLSIDNNKAVLLSDRGVSLLSLGGETEVARK